MGYDICVLAKCGLASVKNKTCNPGHCGVMDVRCEVCGAPLIHHKAICLPESKTLVLVEEK